MPRKESFVLTDGMFLIDRFNHKRCVHSFSPVVCVLSELQGFGFFVCLLVWFFCYVLVFLFNKNRYK